MSQFYISSENPEADLRRCQDSQKFQTWLVRSRHERLWFKMHCLIQMVLNDGERFVRLYSLIRIDALLEYCHSACPRSGPARRVEMANNAPLGPQELCTVHALCRVVLVPSGRG